MDLIDLAFLQGVKLDPGVAVVVAVMMNLQTSMATLYPRQTSSVQDRAECGEISRSRHCGASTRMRR